MSEKHTFPYKIDWQQGMSLRDYFAAKALLHPWSREIGLVATDECEAYEVARRAYAMADAMLKEREKEKK